MTDQMRIYDSVIHNPTAEEKTILGGILFQEKFEYHYKVDDRYVYYLKEDVEKSSFLARYENRESFRGSTNWCIFNKMG